MSFFLKNCYTQKLGKLNESRLPLFIKMDEDVVINAIKFGELIRKLSERKEEAFIAGMELRSPYWGPNREAGSRDFVPFDVYPHSRWLYDYVGGATYFMTAEACRMLFEYLKCLPAMISIEDVEISGNLRERLKIPIIPLTRHWFPFGIQRDVLSAAYSNAITKEMENLIFVHYMPQLSDKNYKVIWDYFVKNQFFT